MNWKTKKRKYLRPLPNSSRRKGKRRRRARASTPKPGTQWAELHASRAVERPSHALLKQEGILNRLRVVGEAKRRSYAIGVDPASRGQMRYPATLAQGVAESLPLVTQNTTHYCAQRKSRRIGFRGFLHLYYVRARIVYHIYQSIVVPYGKGIYPVLRVFHVVGLHRQQLQGSSVA